MRMIKKNATFTTRKTLRGKYASSARYTPLQ